MSVTLSPSKELGFHRPLTQLVKRTLAVSNHNHQPIVYKVKTTAPKQYCVRPNSGRIEPGETIEVQVLLQPMKEDPAPGTKCRDKFLVQSVVVTPDRDSSSLAELWAQVEKDDKANPDKASEIHEQKIRCAFLAPVDEASNGPEDTTSTPPASAIRSSSVSKASAADAGDQSFSSTLASQPPANASESSTKSPSPLASSLTDEPDTPSISTRATDAVAGAAAAVGLTSVASAVKPESAPASDATAARTGPSSDVTAELTAARAEIASLKTQLAKAQETNASSLRQRSNAGSKPDEKAASSEAGAAQAVMDKAGDGVPVKVVMGIVVFVFVGTWYVK